MKIEKITENKIRILVRSEDIHEKDIDLHAIMSKAIEQPQGFFLEMLKRAEAEVGFNTDGYKLLIEAYSSPDEDLVFTITKYLDVESESNTNISINSNASSSRKKVVPKRKRTNTPPKNRIYSFENFDAFCELCSYLKNSKLQVRGIAKCILLREFKGTYYLIIGELSERSIGDRNLFAAFSEFGKITSYSPTFQSKLQEHGRRIMGHNALNKGIKYFA